MEPLTESNAYKLLEKYLMSEEELRTNGYPRPCPTEKGKAIIMETGYRKKISSDVFERTCKRCRKKYWLNDQLLPRTESECTYHWGKMKIFRGYPRSAKYVCCELNDRSTGCTTCKCHVSDMITPDNQRGFVQTFEKSNPTSGLIFALDCEMCYTTAGIEVLRVTVIDYSGKPVYDTLVKPTNTVLDYATIYHGVDENSLKEVTTTLADVQSRFCELIDNKTILIGHSLENDLFTLKLLHDRVVDSSIVFSTRRYPPLKRALKKLCSDYLGKSIQSGSNGHDSAEDASACMELMLWKINKDAKCM